jgi:small subunit ribosomal protein S30e
MDAYKYKLSQYNCYRRSMPTHGSLTKAGKVRGQTPKIQGKPRLSPIARLRNKNNFVKRFEKKRVPGQKKPERRGGGSRR